LQRQQHEKGRQNVDGDPPRKLQRTRMATLTLSASFQVWANQAKLTMYEIEN